MLSIVMLTVQQKKALEITHIAGTIIIFLLTLYYAITNGPTEGIWLHDALSRYFALIIGIIYLLAGIFSIRYLLPEYLHGKLNFVKLQRYYALLHAFAGTMLVSVTLNNLGLAWVAIELTTLSSALLVGFYNTKPSLEAAWKYIFLCSVGIAIALFGIIMTFYATENVLGTELAALNWTNLLQNAKLLDPLKMRYST